MGYHFISFRIPSIFGFNSAILWKTFESIADKLKGSWNQVLLLTWIGTDYWNNNSALLQNRLASLSRVRNISQNYTEAHKDTGQVEHSTNSFFFSIAILIDLYEIFDFSKLPVQWEKKSLTLLSWYEVFFLIILGGVVYKVVFAAILRTFRS